MLSVGVAKWYGGRLENGYAQACRGSNPFPDASTEFKISSSFLLGTKFRIDEFFTGVNVG